MAQTDPNGITHIDETDSRSPFSDLMRIITDPLSSVISSILGSISTLQGTVDPLAVNYPWTTMVALNGWTANTGSIAPQVCRVGDLAFYRGALYGGTANTQAFLLPVWARPDRTTRVPMTLATGAVGHVRIFNGGAWNPSGAPDGETLIMWKVDV